MAEADFRRCLAELGATPAYGKWLGNNRPHKVICKAAHACEPTPSYVRSGGGCCRTCAGLDPEVAAAGFRERLAVFGAVAAWEKWEGVHARHHVICIEGHDCWPTPSSLRAGNGPCRTCAGQDPATAEAAFRCRLAELGYTPLFEKWAGNGVVYDVICPAGHRITARPGDVRSGKRPCLTCCGQDNAANEAAYRELILSLGGTPAWDEWRGRNQPHKVICPAGHEWPSIPSSVRRGGNMCRICAGLDTATVEADYRRILAELGATPAWAEWRGVDHPHDVICKNGHPCSPLPGNVRRGRGPCRWCMGKEWDVFYVVVSDALGLVKFGVTSGDPQSRLGDHRRKGYSRTVLVIRDIDAWPVERAVISALEDHGYEPAEGIEYFEWDALDLILEVAQGHDAVKRAA